MTGALHLWLRRHNRVTTLLVAALAACAIYLTSHRHWRIDLTANARHTLSAASRMILNELPGRVTVTAYTSLQDEDPGDQRQPIRDFVARYRYLKPDLSLKFVDPRLDANVTSHADVKANGQLVLSYRDRQVQLGTLNERDFTDALLRLARPEQRAVAFSSGHGERSVTGSAPQDLGAFGHELAKKGLRPSPLNLSTAEEVPSGIRVLVVTRPGTALAPRETATLARYVARGGNLLWLLEPGELNGLQGLAETLNLSLPADPLLDAAAPGQGSAAAAISSHYGNHPVTEQFGAVTFFPNARAIAFNDNPGWRATVLVQATSGGQTSQVAAGPFVVGVALERESKDDQQRIAIIGSADFLSNTYIDKGANLDLGVNLVNWLAGDSNLIAIQPRQTLDATLELDQTRVMALALGFMGALPLAFFVAAAIIRHRRNRG